MESGPDARPSRFGAIVLSRSLCQVATVKKPLCQLGTSWSATLSSSLNPAAMMTGGTQEVAAGILAIGLGLTVATTTSGHGHAARHAWFGQSS